MLFHGNESPFCLHKKMHLPKIMFISFKKENLLVTEIYHVIYDALLWKIIFKSPRFLINFFRHIWICKILYLKFLLNEMKFIFKRLQAKKLRYMTHNSENSIICISTIEPSHRRCSNFYAPELV